jgi:multidrug resistance efflux pump
MERIQEPVAPLDAEVQAELDRVQTELAAAQRKVESLEEQLSASSADVDRWASRALHNLEEPEPSASQKLKVLLVGALLGGLVATLFHAFGA